MSGPNSKENDRALYLEEISVESNTTTQFRVKLQIDGNDIRTTHDEQTLIWKPFHSLKLTLALKIVVIITAGRSVAGISFGKLEGCVDISGQEAIDAFWGPKSLVVATTFDNRPITVSFKLRPSPTLGVTYEHMLKVQDAMKRYKLLMESSKEQGLDTFIAYGVALSDVNPAAKMAFSVVKVTFDMLQEQSKYDELVLDLAESLGKILPYADHILEDALYDELEPLDLAFKKLCITIVETTAFIGEYVKKSATNRILESLAVLEDKRAIKGLQEQFVRLEEDLNYAVLGVALKAASGIENDILLERLKPVDTANYHEDRGCMDGTRVAVINDIVTWATKSLSEDRTSQSSNVGGVLWLYGMPGIGKSSIAHSICHRLHESKQLGGSFFCRRDDPVLSETKMVLPTLIYGLAGRFGPYRNCVVQALRDDPQLAPQSASGELFLNTLKALKMHPRRTSVLLIDALDECGKSATRRQLLGHLTEVCKQNQWLKVIVTSRPEHDIRSFFIKNGVSGRDLSQDDQDRNDIRHFTEARMKWVANKQHQDPEELIGEGRLGRIVNRSGGLFLFVETLSQYLVGYRDPKPALNRLMGEVPAAIAALRNIAACSNKFDDQIVKLAEDALRFVFAFTGPISTSAPHIYLSALPFTPVESSVWKNACKSFPNLARVSEGRMQKWPTNSGFGEGHTEWIECVAYSLDGKNIVSGSWDKTIRIWDAVTGTAVGDPLKGHEDVVASIVYSPDGQKIASGSWDGTIRVWDAVTGARIGEPLKGHTHHVVTVAYSPNGRNIASGSSDHTIRIWDAAAGMPIGEPLRGHSGEVTSVIYSPDGRRIASGSDDCTIRTWNAETGEPIGEPLKGHGYNITSVTYSPNGLNIVSGSIDRTIRIWDAETGVSVGEPLKGHTGHVLSVAYSPDGRNIASGSADHTIRIWDATAGTPIGEPFKGNANDVTGVAYSPDGTRIVSGSHNCTIRVWDAVTGDSMSGPLKVHNDRIASIAYSPDGRNIVSGLYDNTIRIWDVATGAPVGEPLKGHIGEVTSVAYSPDRRSIASGSWDRTIRMWDALTGVPIGEPLKGHEDTVNSVIYSPDGQNIASGSNDHTIRIWDVATGSPVGEPLRGPLKGVADIAYSPDGQRIVSACAREIQIWDVATREVVGKSLKGHTAMVRSVAYSRDGAKIVSSSRNMIQIWDAVTGAPIGKQLKGHDAITGVAWSHDGKNFVSGSEDSTLRIWDALTGTPIGEALKGHTDKVISIAYSPDGRSIASGSWDCTIRIWDATTGALVADRPTVHADTTINSGSPYIRNTTSNCTDHPNPALDTQDTLSTSMGAQLGRPSPSTDVLDKHSSGPFGPSAVSGITLDPESMDPDGWVRCDGGNLLWIPEDSREGVTSPAIMIISTQERQRCVRLDLSNLRYGNSWTGVYEGT
ncbi:hypothetical protein M408DRAFT_333160 [Serendipita vermifera MAFF 305830]|uniref:Nephrocystin 3-like N-terminal domain-containing protein n=1 Tax=Serendipita vermifera MAFF 305830 TaxID=933852 RepID=A0A0C3APF3_SERVB|nr:hypothetical protein M408DRAFT_333160 [Serendipita vermifera MAFF 305830]